MGHALSKDYITSFLIKSIENLGSTFVWPLLFSLFMLLINAVPYINFIAFAPYLFFLDNYSFVDKLSAYDHLRHKYFAGKALSFHNFLSKEWNKNRQK